MMKEDKIFITESNNSCKNLFPKIKGKEVVIVTEIAFLEKYILSSLQKTAFDLTD